MSSNGGAASTVFKVQKDTGDWWDMVYGKNGVRWIPSTNPLEEGPKALRVSPGPMGVIADVADAGARVALWWETRQQRLLDEAVHEERRIVWLADLVGRWGELHRGGGQLDFRVSEYLAREARGTLSALAMNKRAALPQSILYELDTILETFREFRSVLLDQFEAVLADEEIGLQNAVRQVMPGSKLNIDFIRLLGTDPSAQWSQQLRDGSREDFDEAIADAFRYSEVFMGRLFPSTELAIAEAEQEAATPNWASRVIGMLTNLLPQPRPELSKAELERRDVFRELLLLPAEVSRVKALHAAWLATGAVFQEATGNELAVRLGAKGIVIGQERVTEGPALTRGSGEALAIGGSE